MSLCPYVLANLCPCTLTSMRSYVCALLSAPFVVDRVEGTEPRKFYAGIHRTLRWKLKYSQIKSSLYSLYYAEACNKFAGSIFASLRPSNAASLEEMSQRWRVVGNTVFDLTGTRFEPNTSRSRDESVTARPTDLF